MRVKSGLFAGHSSSFTQTLECHVFIKLTLCPVALLCCNGFNLVKVKKKNCYDTVDMDM